MFWKRDYLNIFASSLPFLWQLAFSLHLRVRTTVKYFDFSTWSDNNKMSSVQATWPRCSVTQNHLRSNHRTLFGKGQALQKQYKAGDCTNHLSNKLLWKRVERNTFQVRYIWCNSSIYAHLFRSLSHAHHCQLAPHWATIGPCSVWLK